jgi:hypothetical protein
MSVVFEKVMHIIKYKRNFCWKTLDIAKYREVLTEHLMLKRIDNYLFHVKMTLILPYMMAKRNVYIEEFISELFC